MSSSGPTAQVSIKIERKYRNINQLPVVLEEEQMFFQSSEVAETRVEELTQISLRKVEMTHICGRNWQFCFLFTKFVKMQCPPNFLWRDPFIPLVDFVWKIRINSLFTEKYNGIMIILGCLKSRKTVEHWKDLLKSIYLTKSSHIEKIFLYSLIQNFTFA